MVDLLDPEVNAKKTECLLTEQNEELSAYLYVVGRITIYGE
jgi:hypothetical protein